MKGTILILQAGVKVGCVTKISFSTEYSQNILMLNWGANVPKEVKIIEVNYFIFKTGVTTLFLKQ